jgi:hypothetical protein
VVGLGPTFSLTILLPIIRSSFYAFLDPFKLPQTLIQFKVMVYPKLSTIHKVFCQGDTISIKEVVTLR